MCAMLLEPVLLGVEAAFKECTLQSEDMKLYLHWPFKEMSHTKGVAGGITVLGGVEDGLGGGGLMNAHKLVTGLDSLL